MTRLFPFIVLAALALMGLPTRVDGGPAHEPYGSSGADTLTTKVVSDVPTAGKSAPVTIRLTSPSGQPVTLDDLIVAHTQKIHLLIVEETLTDYHHEHPVPTGTPGEYRFDFAPRYGGIYHLWADLVPISTGKQQYSQTLMQIDGPPATPVQTINSTADAGDLRFEISLENNTPFHARSATLIKAKVTTKDGRDFTNLEPVMGAFAHMVAFPTALNSIAHIHPLGKEPEQPSERGGPDLSFYFVPEKEGFYKMFLQIQVGGRNRFAAFGVNVEPPLPGSDGPGEYTCPMHPEVSQPGPTKCPKCGMDLVKK